MKIFKADLAAVIFDFDGVLVESASVKTEAFTALFQDYPDLLNQIIGYHLAHAGISRHVKIRWIFENIIQKSITDAQLHSMANRFSELVMERVINAPWVNGVPELLEFLQKRCHCFIASGTPQSELIEIAERRDCAQYFKGIFGSPDTKETIVSRILSTYRLPAHACLFVGDALTDLHAAKANGVPFIGRITDENRGIWPDDIFCVNDMHQLRQYLINYYT
jgi:phosphoglycolate phosphatase-like HAD superfamily hydrolase